jgi:prepilin-type N-terminal cleavage/methylation domain-containing protein
MSASNSTSVSKETLGSERGFTLLEILIAISILALISLAVVSITENAALTKERTTEVNENNLQIETAMSRLEWDLSQIYSPMYFSTLLNMNAAQPFNQAPDGQDTAGGRLVPQTTAGAAGGMGPLAQQYFEQLVQRFERNEHFLGVSKEGMPVPRFYAPEKNVFEFFTTSNRRKVENQKQSHFAWVRYALAEQEQTEAEEQNANMPKSLKSLVRYFSPDDPYSEKRINIEDVARVKGAVLLRNVEQLEFQFWDLQRRKWETSLRNIQGGESVIRGVRVLVTWYDSFGNKRSTARIFRTHWPLVTPQDQATGAPANQAGVQAGPQAGAAGGGLGDGALTGGIPGGGGLNGF